jgi:hypothetical protein
MWPLSRWSCDMQFHKYAVHINGDFWWLAPPTNFVGRHYRFNMEKVSGFCHDMLFHYWLPLQK